MRNWILVVVIAVTLSGCAAWTLVEGERQHVAGRYWVAPQIAWSRFKQGDVEVWTVDGAPLQALRFFDALDDDEPLFRSPVQSDDKLPRFRSNMTATEVQEFVVHSVERSGGAQVKASGLRPWSFGALQGFRFELEFRNEGGLEMQGVLVGVVDGEKLFLIAYTGTRAHYYPKYLPAVERLLASISTSA